VTSGRSCEDKRRSLWIAAEDCPDGAQIEEAYLDILLDGLKDRTGPGPVRRRVPGHPSPADATALGLA
jgi:hypothetical protein